MSFTFVSSRLFLEQPFFILMITNFIFSLRRILELKLFNIHLLNMISKRVEKLSICKSLNIL